MLPYIACMDPMGNIPYKLRHVETAFSGACLLAGGKPRV